MTPIHFRPGDPIGDSVADFVSLRVFGEPGRFDRFAAMGVFDHGVLVAGVVYHNWHKTERVIEFSGAGDNGKWMSRRILRECFGFAFNMMKARLVVLRVGESNVYMRDIAAKFGFQETLIPRIRSDSEGECVHTFGADQWREHRINHG